MRLVLKSILAPNGITLGVHKVIKVESDLLAARTTLIVSSWPDLLAYGMVPPAWTFYETLPVPVLAALPEDALVAEGTFEGAALVEDGLTGIDRARALAWARVKAARSVAIDAGFSAVGMQFDSDAVARANIIGAVADALAAISLEQPFLREYTLADNSVVALNDPPLMLAVGRALADHVEAQHAIARTLRETINDPDRTIAELDAVAWPAQP